MPGRSVPDSTGAGFGERGGSVSTCWCLGKGWCLSIRARRQMSCRHGARFQGLQLPGSGFLVRMQLADAQMCVWPALQSTQHQCSTEPTEGPWPCPSARSHTSGTTGNSRMAGTGGWHTTSLPHAGGAWGWVLQ